MRTTRTALATLLSLALLVILSNLDARIPAIRGKVRKLLAG